MNWLSSIRTRQRLRRSRSFWAAALVLGLLFQGLPGFQTQASDKIAGHDDVLGAIWLCTSDGWVLLGADGEPVDERSSDGHAHCACTLGRHCCGSMGLAPQLTFTFGSAHASFVLQIEQRATIAVTLLDLPRLRGPPHFLA